MSDLLGLAQQIVQRAQGNEQIEVFVASSTEVEVEAYQGAIENLTTASSDGVGIRILRDGASGAQVGSAWAGSLDADSIEMALREARDNVQFATEDEFLAFARPDGVAAQTLNLVSDDVERVSLDEKIAMAIELEQATRKADPRIRQVDSARYSDYISSSAIATSTGIAARYARTGAYLTVSPIATDGKDDQSGWGLSAGRGPRDLNLDQVVIDAVRRATRMLGAVKPQTQKTVAVFDPRTAATLMSIIGGSLSGEAVVRGRSYFAGRLGELVGATSVTLIDDPTDPRHFSASTYDGEGLACRRNVLIEDGVLNAFVYDTVSARRAGTTSTGSALRGGIGGSPSAGCRALQMTPGTMSQDEIFRAIGNGIFVESLNGIHSGVNPISGDFSVGVTGLMIRDGELAEPVREATVASTLQRMLQDILHVGSDQEWLPGTAAGQSLAIDGLSISGS